MIGHEVWDYNHTGKFEDVTHILFSRMIWSRANTDDVFIPEHRYNNSSTIPIGVKFHWSLLDVA